MLPTLLGSAREVLKATLSARVAHREALADQLTKLRSSFDMRKAPMRMWFIEDQLIGLDAEVEELRRQLSTTESEHAEHEDR